MKIKIWQVDAFAQEVFTGNPACVCLLSEWLPDEVMQKIAMENNLSETAFTIPEKEGFAIRWFTPLVEVDLCGHATLATAHIIFTETGYPKNEIKFSSKSGMLSVRKDADKLILNFPADDIQPITAEDALINAMGFEPVEVLKGVSDYLLVYKTQSEVEKLSPDFQALAAIPVRGIIATAKGNEVDFVSRFFGPAVGVNEDPVTGSAHTTLIPYWAKVLNKTEMQAIQLSERKGWLACSFLGSRVEIGGKAVTYLQGTIEI
ncbi:MAG: PhzF family phenazine biosynthesis protein [Bacteroidota bacterium]